CSSAGANRKYALASSTTRSRPLLRWARRCTNRALLYTSTASVGPDSPPGFSRWTSAICQRAASSRSSARRSSHSAGSGSGPKRLAPPRAKGDEPVQLPHPGQAAVHLDAQPLPCDVVARQVRLPRQVQVDLQRRLQPLVLHGPHRVLQELAVHLVTDRRDVA